QAFVPVVITGESMDRAGGVKGVSDVLTRYIPFVRDLQGYFGTNGAIPAQLTALKEGAAPYSQLQSYTDGVRDLKAEYEPLATVLGYSSVDGLLASDMGQAAIRPLIDQAENDLAKKYPTGWRMTTDFANTTAIDAKA